MSIPKIRGPEAQGPRRKVRAIQGLNETGKTARQRK